MKYPKKNKPLLKVPFENNHGNWCFGELKNDNTVKRVGLSYYEKEKHAWIPCNAFNKRYYTDKKINKILKKYYDVEKIKEEIQETKKRRK